MKKNSYDSKKNPEAGIHLDSLRTTLKKVKNSKTLKNWKTP